MDDGKDEIALAGGFVTGVARVGDTVRRGTGPWSWAVHALLAHLESVGYPSAPRFLGIDEAGREILSFIEGVVPDGAHTEVVTDAALADVGRRVRTLHRATADFTLPPAWRGTSSRWADPLLTWCATMTCPRRTRSFERGAPWPLWTGT